MEKRKQVLSLITAEDVLISLFLLLDILYDFQDLIQTIKTVKFIPLDIFPGHSKRISVLCHVKKITEPSFSPVPHDVK